MLKKDAFTHSFRPRKDLYFWNLALDPHRHLCRFVTVHKRPDSKTKVAPPSENFFLCTNNRSICALTNSNVWSAIRSSGCVYNYITVEENSVNTF